MFGHDLALSPSVKSRNRTRPPVVAACQSGILVALSLTLTLKAQTILEGDYILDPSSTEQGDFTISGGNVIVSQGNITAAQRIDAGVGIDFGTNSANQPAVSFDFFPSLKVARFDASEADSTFRWSQQNASKMMLDGSNILRIYNSAGQIGLQLDPNAGQIKLSGTSSGIYNSAGNAVMQIGSGGVASFPGSVAFSQGIQAAGTDSYFNGVRVGMGGGNRGENTVLGNGALANNTGWDHVAIGYRALASNTTGTSNVAIGREAMMSNTVGSENIAIGQHTLTYNISGYNNIAMGRGALHQSTSGANNIALGNGSLFSNITGGSNVALGAESLYFNKSDGNTASGVLALYLNTTGSLNVATGYMSLFRNETGSNNTIAGFAAAQFNSSGSGNVMLGYDAGSYQANALPLSAAQDSIYIGKSSRGFSNSDSNSIVIGSNAIGEGTNTTVIGNSSTSKARIHGILQTPGVETGQVKLQQTNGALDALSVEGRTRLNGEVIISAPQGDISMGIYE